MLSKLLEVPELQELLPFARFAHGETTTYVWEDEEGAPPNQTGRRGRARGSAHALAVQSGCPQRAEGREEQHDPLAQCHGHHIGNRCRDPVARWEDPHVEQSGNPTSGH